MNEQEKPERDAEVFVKGVKRRTRKKFTAEENIRIVLEGMKRDPALGLMSKSSSGLCPDRFHTVMLPCSRRTV